MRDANDKLRKDRVSISRKRNIHPRWYQFRNRYSIMTCERLKGRRKNDLSRCRTCDIGHLTCKSARGSFFRKCKSSRESRRMLAVSRQNKLRRMNGRRDDIQIRARRKWRKYTYDTHPSYITRNWLVFRYQGIEFRLHPAGRRAFVCVSQKTPVSIIQIFVIMSHNLGMTSLLVWRTIGWPAASGRGFCK